MTEYCEHGIEASGSIKCGKFTDQLQNYQLVRKDAVTCSHTYNDAADNGHITQHSWISNHQVQTLLYERNVHWKHPVGRVLACKYFSLWKQHDLAVVYLIKMKIQEPRKKCWPYTNMAEKRVDGAALRTVQSCFLYTFQYSYIRWTLCKWMWLLRNDNPVTVGKLQAKWLGISAIKLFSSFQLLCHGLVVGLETLFKRSAYVNTRIHWII